MKVLIFQAAVSASAIAAMTRFADELRQEGHQAGVRSLPHFRREKEPADRIIVALTPTEAERYKTIGAELVQTFVDTELFTPLELPEDPKELDDFDFSDAIGNLDDDTTGYMTLDQLRAEALERGIEVTAQSTREELEHLLDIDYHPGRQASDRRTDTENNQTDGIARDRVGLRVSTVLPQANGMDLERMNDEQLAATAAQLGIKVPKGARRDTVINKITKVYATRVQAPQGSGVKSPADPNLTKDGDDDDVNSDLEGKSEDELKQIAEDEEVDVGRATSVEGLTAKIVEARKAKVDGE